MKLIMKFKGFEIKSTNFDLKFFCNISIWLINIKTTQKRFKCNSLSFFFGNIFKIGNSQAFSDNPRQKFQKRAPDDFKPCFFNTLQHKFKKNPRNM
jgi:hypothetical protein